MRSPSLKTLALTGVLALAACAPRTTAAGAGSRDAAFLAQNAKADGVHVTRSGLEYRVLTSGPADGAHPRRSDQVRVNYEVKLLTGEIIDSSFQRGQPDVMRVGELIKAWSEALPLMRPGDEWEIWAPPALAYGDKDTGPIPGGSVLDFRIQLLAIEP